MKKSVKSALCLLLIFCMALSIAACGEEDEAINANNKNNNSTESTDTNTPGEESTEPTSHEPELPPIEPMDCTINTVILQGKTVYLTEVLGDLFEQFMRDEEHIQNHRYVYEESKQGTDVRLSGRKILEERHKLDEQLITEHTTDFLICDNEGSYEIHMYLHEVVGTRLMEARIMQYQIAAGSFILGGTQYDLDVVHIDEMKALDLEFIGEYDDYGSEMVFAIEGVFNRVAFRYNTDSGIVHTAFLYNAVEETTTE